MVVLTRSAMRNTHARSGSLAAVETVYWPLYQNYRVNLGSLPTTNLNNNCRSWRSYVQIGTFIEEESSGQVLQLKIGGY